MMEQLNFRIRNLKYSKEKLSAPLLDEDRWQSLFEEDGHSAYKVRLGVESEEISSLLSQLSFLGRIDAWYMMIHPKEKIRWHVDHNKSANIIIGLSDSMSVQQMQGGNIYEYFYDEHPLLLNVKVKHRVINRLPSGRRALYLSLFDADYTEACRELRKRGMLHE